jgi:hypothetical protein
MAQPRGRTSANASLEVNYRATSQRPTRPALDADDDDDEPARPQRRAAAPAAPAAVLPAAAAPQKKPKKKRSTKPAVVPDLRSGDRVVIACGAHEAATGAMMGLTGAHARTARRAAGQVAQPPGVQLGMNLTPEERAVLEETKRTMAEDSRREWTEPLCTCHVRPARAAAALCSAQMLVRRPK